ncbi:MAG TPA: glutaminase, partial [Alistipes obesi]|nr:glutaminase [Alistipes communis]
GLPAKTGVGGGIMAVIPGVMGLAAFAPPLDSAGNSVKAQKALEYISVRLGLNIFSPARVELAAAEPVREGVCK